MGHLTTRHYMAMFDDASYVLLSEATGWSPNDPEWAGLEIFADPVGGEHAPVAHEDDPGEAEAVSNLLHLGSDRRRIAGVSIEDLHRHRAAFLVAEESDDDLQLPLLPIPVVASPGKRALSSLEVRRSDVVEDEGVVEMEPGEPVFDLLLSGQEPVHSFVELILRHRAEGEFVPQGRDRGLIIDPLGDGELGSGVDDPRDDHCHHEIPLPRGPGGDPPHKAQAPECAEGGGDVPVGQAPEALEAVVDGDEAFALEGPADDVDHPRGEVGEVAQRLVLDLAAVAEGAPEEVSFVGLVLVASPRGGYVNGSSALAHA